MKQSEKKTNFIEEEPHTGGGWSAFIRCKIRRVSFVGSAGGLRRVLTGRYVRGAGRGPGRAGSPTRGEPPFLNMHLCSG